MPALTPRQIVAELDRYIEVEPIKAPNFLGRA